MIKDVNYGKIPTFHIVAYNIPQAHYEATKIVYENGKQIRTQYDRKDSGTGNFIDPPSRDAKVLIEVTNPFNEPRFPIQSYMEIGTYYAEILGAKDHLVPSFNELVEGLKNGELSTKWPYTYSQRLTKYPFQNGEYMNQLEMVIDRVAKSPITRRAVAMTGVPEIDVPLKDDMPCLREIQIRAIEEEDGEMYLHLDTKWRSRDLYKAWHDNVLALTFLQQFVAHQLSEKMGREVKVGSYSDYSSSLHIYGQDVTEKGVKQYIDMGEEKVILRASEKQDKLKSLIPLQIDELIEKKDYWNFSKETLEWMNGLSNDIKVGKLKV